MNKLIKASAIAVVIHISCAMANVAHATKIAESSRLEMVKKAKFSINKVGAKLAATDEKVLQRFPSLPQSQPFLSESISKKKSEKKQSARAVNEAKSPSKGAISRGRTLHSYKVAHANVSTSCFPRELRNILSKVHKRYGVKPIVKSGHRSAAHNRRVGGARNSLHIRCHAADITVPGVGKYKLARYLKTVPGVGGVGTYGCKSIVHVDIGNKRHWHTRCRKRRA